MSEWQAFDRWSILLTGEQHGLVGPYNETWGIHPPHMERVAVVRESVADKRIAELEGLYEQAKADARVYIEHIHQLEEYLTMHPAAAPQDELPEGISMPSAEALEVFKRAIENHRGDLPFDGRLIPYQWLLNERRKVNHLQAIIDTNVPPADEYDEYAGVNTAGLRASVHSEPLSLAPADPCEVCGHVHARHDECYPPADELARLIEALHEHTAAVPALALRKNPDMLGADDDLWLRWRDVKKAIEGERG